MDEAVNRKGKARKLFQRAGVCACMHAGCFVHAKAYSGDRWVIMVLGQTQKHKCSLEYRFLARFSWQRGLMSPDGIHVPENAGGVLPVCVCVSCDGLVTCSVIS